MKSPFLICAQIVFAASYIAAQSPNIDAHTEITEQRRKLEAAPLEPISEAMPLLIHSAALIGHYPSETELGFDRTAVALSSIKQIPGYERWFRERFQSLFPPGFIKRNEARSGTPIKLVPIPETQRDGAFREQCELFITLERLATSKAVSILGDYLWDDRYVKESKGCVIQLPLDQISAYTLSRIAQSQHFADAPTNSDLVKWQEWWTKNKTKFSSPSN